MLFLRNLMKELITNDFLFYGVLLQYFYYKIVIILILFVNIYKICLFFFFRNMSNKIHDIIVNIDYYGGELNEKIHS